MNRRQKQLELSILASLPNACQSCEFRFQGGCCEPCNKCSEIDCGKKSKHVPIKE